MDIKIDDDRIGRPPYRRSLLSRALGVLVPLAGLALFGAVAVVIFVGGDPQTLRRVALDAVWPAAAHDFGKVYAALSIKPIPAADFDTPLYDGLIRLEAEPCDQGALSAVSKSLVAKKETTLAAEANLGFSQSCHGEEHAEREAGRLFFSVGDYRNARAVFSDLTDRFPHYDNDWYNKGRAEAALGERDAALQSYASTIAMAPKQGMLLESVFTEMAALYAAQDRFCEAMAPIEAYVAMSPQQRDTSRSRTLLETYSLRGHCTAYASGSDSFPAFDRGVIKVRATVDGTTGTFLVDTGATFVAVTSAFAAKAKLKIDEAHVGKAVTANGDASVRLTKAAAIRVGRVQAQGVPVVVLSTGLGTADGLLGRAFLSRFDMSIAGDRLTLKSKN